MNPSSLRAWVARLALPLAIVLPATAQSETTPASVPDSGFAARYERYAVAADHPIASAAGAEILSRGGNAVDAAVATSFTLSVVRPFSCGIGGGGFMLISLPAPEGSADGTRIERAINYREMAPSGASPEAYEQLAADRASLDGGMACGVPGTVAGLLYALETYGTMDREAVMAPAIRAAREGFAVDAAYMRSAMNATERFVVDKAYQERFAFVWERLLGAGTIREGDIVRNEEQALVLEAIARHGAAAFYEGPLAGAIIGAVNADVGATLANAGKDPQDWFTAEDFASPRAGPRVEDGEPLVVEFLGRRALLMPPPSSGGIAIGQVMGLAERRQLGRLWTEGASARYAHELAESFKFAFADRATHLADPRFERVPVGDLLGAARLDGFAARITATTTHGPEYYGELAGLAEDGGTSHLSVVDADGGAVACTETINTEFGSFFVAPGTGFCLNNQMDDFTTRRDKPNAYGLRQSEKNLPKPGKRPLSSMSPTIVMGKDGQVEMVAGASGGPRIITATTQVVLNLLVRGMSAKDAVSAKRMHHQWLPNVLEIEKGFDDAEVMRGLGVSMWLRKLHHEVKDARSSAVVQAITRKAGANAVVIEAACDPRKGGKPAGQ